MKSSDAIKVFELYNTAKCIYGENQFLFQLATALPAFTCSKSTMETQEQFVNHAQSSQ